jgi:FtsZ-binding cell division protein ZapB
MACEHAVLIEPVTPDVYTNKHPQCNLFYLLVVALCVISFIVFVTYIKTFVYELKTEVTNLKYDNQRLANKVEAMNISQLNMEIVKLKDDNQCLANKVESINISELRDGLDEVKDDNQRLANKVESINISQFNMEIIKLKTEIDKLNSSFDTFQKKKFYEHGEEWARVWHLANR